LISSRFAFDEKHLAHLQEQNLPEPQVSEEIASDSDKDDEEDEDETTPENLFDAWNVGEEENIGCQ
jgi:hypothetical protein